MLNLIESIKSRIKRKYNYLTDRKILKANLNFKDIHSGQRCFIIGNGPSVKEQDISKLKNEWTFVVNGFYLHEQYDAIHPKFYAVFDSKHFWDNQEALDFLANLNKKVHSDTIMIFPLKAKRFIEKNKVLPDNKKIYMHVKGELKEGRQNSVFIDQTIPTPTSVSVACLMVAIYMGFDPIYLMGLEHDWLKQRITDREEANHFYTADKQYLTNPFDYTYESSCLSIANLFKNYRLLQEGTNKKIVNLTPGSYLDIFPFGKYEDVVN